MLARFGQVNSKYFPYVLGAAAVAYGGYICTKNIHNDNNKVFIGDDKWIDLPITKIEQLSGNTKRFTFKFPHDDDVSGLNLASALLTKFVTPKGSNVIRPYTPVSDLSTKGEIHLVIKHYPGGKMTDHLFSLKTDDTVSFKGPIPKWQWKANSFDEITLIGGGTGITPLYQLIHHIVQNPNDKTKVNLFYGSKTPADILLKSELDAFQKKYPDQFKVHYFVDEADDSFSGNKGFITKEVLSKNAAKPSAKTQVFICGPPGFMKAYSGEKVSPKDQGDLVGILKDLGYSKEQVFKF